MSELATEIEAGGGTNEAVALALGWHRQLVLEDRTPEDCDRAEHVSHTETPWWHGPGGERSKYLPPDFLTDLNALDAECDRRFPDNPQQPFREALERLGERFNLHVCWWPIGEPFSRWFPRYVCAALVRAVESEAGMSERPIRVQLSRAKGWRMPPNTVSVARPGPFGNPFTLKGCREAGFQGTDTEIAARVVGAFDVWISTPYWRENWSGPESQKAREIILARLPELRGKNLACWCPLDQPCHADVLLELANS